MIQSVCVCVYIYIYVHVHVHVDVDADVDVCVCVGVCVYIYIYTYVCVYMYIYIYLYLFIYLFIYRYMHSRWLRIWGLKLVKLGSTIGKALNSGIRVWLEFHTSSGTHWGKQGRGNPTKDSCCVGFLHSSPQPPAQSPSRGLSMRAKGAKFSDETNPSAASGLFWPHHLRRSLHLVPPMSPPQ